MMSIRIQALGQSGYLFEIDGGKTRFLVDPYLSDYVEEKEGEEFKRLIKAPVMASEMEAIDFVFCTHAHWDHCDPHTIHDLYQVNSNLKVIAPYECQDNLNEAGLPESSFILAAGIASSDATKENWQSLAAGIEWKAIPVAHTKIERNAEGHSRYCAFLFKIEGRIFYHAGDCIPHEETRKMLPSNIELAFVPVNERNCYRDRIGIVGNMTVRESLAWIEETGARKWVPMHHDTFPLNRTYPEEVNFLAEKENVKDKIHWLPAGEWMEPKI